MLICIIQALSTAHILFLHQAITPAIPFCLHSSFNSTLEALRVFALRAFGLSPAPRQPKAPGEAAGFSLGQMPIQLEVQLTLKNPS